MDDITRPLALIKTQEAVISAQEEKLRQQEELISIQNNQIKLLGQLNGELHEKNLILSRQLSQSNDVGRKLAGILDGLYDGSGGAEK